MSECYILLHVSSTHDELYETLVRGKKPSRAASYLGTEDAASAFE